jgi:hypothetical protein
MGQWLPDKAFAIPPAHLVVLIKEKALIKNPVVTMLATAALEALAHNL